ncbi:MAG: hypothetical protein M0T70_02540 [Geobacteraceae bacterium]|nr:hypothetical protein [Geobacteraceae bacterium]
MTMTWNEVFEVHRKIAAVYFGGGKIKSMLFSQDKRRNRHHYKVGSTLYFCFDSSKNSSEIRLVKTVLEAGDVFRVFEKIAPDVYEDAGLHICKSIGDGVDDLKRPSLVVTVEPYAS